MYVCVCMCMFMCVCMCVCMCVYVCVCVCVCMHVHVCMYACMHVCMHACVYVCMCVHCRKVQKGVERCRTLQNCTTTKDGRLLATNTRIKPTKAVERQGFDGYDQDHLVFLEPSGLIYKKAILSGWFLQFSLKPSLEIWETLLGQEVSLHLYLT